MTNIYIRWRPRYFLLLSLVIFLSFGGYALAYGYCVCKNTQTGDLVDAGQSCHEGELPNCATPFFVPYSGDPHVCMQIRDGKLNITRHQSEECLGIIVDVE
jgi:hypothetical protein